MAEQSALEEHLRRQGWEQGNIDYMGKDSFSNIWQKICDTLATASQPSAAETLTQSASEVSTTPVAPVAAPVFVSSVEMSPTGPIDTSPPASYVPVSSSKPTVVDSETEAALKAASAETVTVVPEPKSSVTEVIPTEAIVTSSASVEPCPATIGGTPAVPDHAAPTLPAVDTTKTEPTPESLTSSQALVLPESSPPLGPPHVTSLKPQVLDGVAVEASTPPLQKTDVPTSLPSGEVGTPAVLNSESATKADTTLTLVEVTSSPDKPAEAVLTPAEAVLTPPTIVSTEIVAPAVSAEAVKATAEVTLTDKPTSTTQIEAVCTPAVELLSNVPSPTTPAEPILTPSNVETTGSLTPVTLVEAVLTPPAVVSTETPTLSTQSDTVLTKTEALPTLSIATMTPSASDTPNITSAIVLPAEPSAPKVNIPIDVPEAVLPSQTIQGTSELQASDVPTLIQSTPEQPQTPTVTEPTPPTSPPAAPVDSSMVTNLQVETEVPATPPVESGLSQPSIATASTEEPPVPPKRKGGSKVSQETKNQKGGKQSKGKK